MTHKRTVLVTGSTDPKALGFTAALALAKEHNFRVILSGRNSGPLSDAVDLLWNKVGGSSGSERRGSTVQGLLLDVTCRASIASALEALSSEDGPLDGGPLDVLINNAGVGAPPGVAGKGTTSMFLATQDTTAIDVANVMSTNVGAVVEVTNALLPLLTKSDAPRIVNVGSARGSNGFAASLPAERTGALVYNASKAALNMVTVMQAKNLPAVTKASLKVNAAAPGHVSTPFNNFTGNRTLEAGAAVYVHLATLPEDGPNGQLIGDHAPFSNDGRFVQLPW